MATNAKLTAGCPHSEHRDERKSAEKAAERLVLEPDTRYVTSYALARELLRSRKVRQAMAEQQAARFKGDRAPVFFLEGEAHRHKRSAVGRFFTPKAVSTRYRPVMERVTDNLMRRLTRTGEGSLDQISFELAVVVVAEIVGLTDSDAAGMARRIEASFADTGMRWPVISPLLAALRALRFHFQDVRPAIRARRRLRSDDLISHLIDQGYTDQEILIECMTYASAGMVTTREFIVISAWHLFERDDLRERFLAGDEAGKLAVLDELLRMEPVAGMLYRRTTEPMEVSEFGSVPTGTLFAIDVRAVNSDPSVAGACPHMADPDRGARTALGGSLMSFGDGHHRCPGWQVAMHETMIFLDRLFNLPGIRLQHAPDVNWSDPLDSYELRNAVVTCDLGSI